MNISFTAFFGACRAELIQLSRSPLLIILTVIQAITFIFLVNFFGTTGAFAPTALIDNDKGYYAKAFIQNLEHAHHSFTLKSMDEQSAQQAVKDGKIVAIITIPKGFSEAIDNRETVPLNVVVDNIDTDMTADIQRALPSAVAAFGKEFQLPNIHVQTSETDLIDHDTGFIPYLVVSALALSSLLIAGILGAVTVAREFESKTADIMTLSPVNPLIPLLGKVFATDIIAILTMMIAVAIVIFGYHVVPIHAFEMAVALLFCILIFSCLGAALGAAIKRTLPVASLVFGISLPLYLFSGTYERERFDGVIIWSLAHTTPLYYAVGILEHAALNLRVTPEAIWFNFLALLCWAIFAVIAMHYLLRRNNL
ncbi:MAG: ABC transporter permease [Candidatus Levyibacteriota bacterium]